tara:strand:+ start:140847 stop:140984 length:138 start_codon:yes stop_codon:yes gene_type:complete
MTFNEANTVEQMILDGVESAGWNYVAGPHTHHAIAIAESLSTEGR